MKCDFNFLYFSAGSFPFKPLEDNKERTMDVYITWLLEDGGYVKIDLVDFLRQFLTDTVVCSYGVLFLQESEFLFMSFIAEYTTYKRYLPGRISCH